MSTAIAETPEVKKETPVEKARLALREAIQHSDSKAFENAYTDFLKNFTAFKDSVTTDPYLIGDKAKTFRWENPAFPIDHRNLGSSHDLYFKHTTDEQADELLKNARAASEIMDKMPVEKRLEFLKILQNKIDEHKEEIILAIVADTTKPYPLAKDEMKKADEWFKFAEQKLAEQITYPETEENKQKGIAGKTRKSLGAVQVITAANYPHALRMAGEIGGLATGNGIIVTAPFKAPNLISPDMQAASEAVDEFTKDMEQQTKDILRKGLIQYSVGVNEHLTKEADLVNFVGSTKVGKQIRALRDGKPTILEMGGSNVVAIMDSALTQGYKDGQPLTADKIADEIYAGLANAGQRCTGPRFLIIQEGAAESVCHALEKKFNSEKDVHIGNPFDDDKNIKTGALVDAKTYEEITSLVKLAKGMGAKIYGEPEIGDEVHEKFPITARNGARWMNSVVIDWNGAIENMKLKALEEGKEFKESDALNDIKFLIGDEKFGPLAHVIKTVKTMDEAVKITNKFDDYKLASAIFSGKQEEIDEFVKGTHATSVVINGAPKDQTPFGHQGNAGNLVMGGDTHFLLFTKDGHPDLEKDALSNTPSSFVLNAEPQRTVVLAKQK